MEKILFATDGSTYSEHAAKMTGEFLEAWPNATCIVLYVSAKENYAYDLAPEAVDRFEEELSSRIEKQIIEGVLSNWKERLLFSHQTGHPSRTICNVAQSEKVDLIVLGSHGRGAIDRALLGSVAHGVLIR
ncbi:universal stress protein, partial [Streptomyces sp. NPDC057555]|uniref:universal stress protein n=1 Tax=Streptomyces sp. NPDC057555 TaxID=3346166 RepID=UPI0036D7A015